MSRDEWRITSAAIEMEMERIAGLLQKSAHYHSRTTAPPSVRPQAEPEAAAQLTPEFIRQR
jgi:hypothetical protein